MRAMDPLPRRPRSADVAIMVGAAVIVVSWLTLLGWGGLILAGAF